MTKKRNPHRGPSLDSFLAEQTDLNRFQSIAIKEVLAWQIGQAMEAEGLSKSAMAARMKTSRAQLDRLLDPSDGNVTLNTLSRAAKVLGRDIKVELA